MPKANNAFVCGPIGSFVTSESALDWVTATHTRGSDPKSAFACGMSMVQNESQKGNDVLNFSWRGYKGFRCGQASVGMRGDGVFLQARSAGANEYFPALAKHATNFSRIDVQTTALLDHLDPQVFRRVFSKLRKPVDVGHRPAEVTIHANDVRGDTVEFGRRTSDRFARFYDKGAQMGVAEPGWLLRWEVQLNGDYAKSFGQHLCSSDSICDEASREVSKYFADVKLRSPGLNAGLSGDGFEFARVPRTSQDNHRLSWLRKSCRPVVSLLNSKGRLTEVLDVLGLHVVDCKIVFDPSRSRS